MRIKKIHVSKIEMRKRQVEVLLTNLTQFASITLPVHPMGSVTTRLSREETRVTGCLGSIGPHKRTDNYVKELTNHIIMSLTN
jgi:hypothetical protein